MAPPAEPPTTITLRVKVPPGSISGGADEFTLGSTVPVSAHIGQVRERIQQAIPSNPTPETQRLLYGGRALVDNGQTLADALNIKRDPSQVEYVIHLLIRGNQSNTAPLSHRQGMGTPTRSASPAQLQSQSQSQPQANVPTPAPQQHAHLHQQQQHVHPNAANHAAVLAQQQALHAQMHVNAANMNRLPPGGLMPFGMQPMHFGQHMPFPQQVVPPWFPQMGAHHVQHNQPPQMHDPPTQNATQSGDASAQEQRQEAAAPQETQPGNLDGSHVQQHPFQNLPSRPLSNQGYHMEGINSNGLPQMQMPQNPPLHGLAGHLPGMPPQSHARQQGPSALDRARENVAEARRRLDVLREAYNAGAEVNTATQHLGQEVEHIENMVQALSDYIDPFQLGNMNGTRARTASPHPVINAPSVGPPINASFLPGAGWQQRAQALRQQQQQQGGATSGSDVTCYLLSSPTGPQAILYSPQHGTFQGSLPLQQATASDTRRTPTTTIATPRDGAVPEQGAQNQAAAAQPEPAQAPAAQQDPLGPLAPVMNHIWLLLRILIFSYFLLGANMGWRRPLALMAIGFGFWMIRMGLLAEGAALRRWWDGIMNDNRQRPPEHPPHAGPHVDGQDQRQQDGRRRLRPGQMPTPEQLAQRLLHEDARVRNGRIQQIRNYLRPIERSAVLLVASLWPGVGEAYVRAREEEERQQAEEEIAARRREEEERQRKEEEEKAKVEEGSAPDEAAGTISDSTSTGDKGASEKAAVAGVESTQ